MTGYVRQSSADIVPTAIVRAGPLNNEYNALRDAFDQANGHKHDGTAAEGHYVPLIADSDARNKVAVDTVNNRVGAFVEVGGAAVEQVRIQDGAIVPVTDNDIDLGTSSLEFKDLYIDGTANIDSLIADTADINAGTIDNTVVGATTPAAATFTTLTSNGSTTLNGTTIPASKTLVVTTDKLSVHAATTSSELASIISDETGSGALVFANSPTLVTPALGTPSSATLTNATGLPLTSGVTGTLPVANGGTGITSFGTGVATFLGTPSSSNLAAAVTDETGTGALVFANSPTLVTPALGTPSSATLTNATGLPIASGVSGLGTGVASALAVNVGSAGAPVINGGALGTPSSGAATNLTGLPLTSGVTGTLPVANGGTGITSFGAGIAAFLGTPSSSNLAAAVTDETGTGALVFANSPTLVTPTLGTPASATLTNATGLPLSTGVIGTLPIANGGTNATTAADARTNLLPSFTGNAGKVVAVNSGATDIEYITVSGTGTVTSVGGTGTVNGITLSGTVTSSGNLTLGGALSGVDLTTQVTGTLPVANGGTGATDAATARTNLAAAGTGVSNTFSQPQVIASISPTLPALRITQTGTSNALLVEDSVNPDSSPFVIDNTGRVIVGHTSSITGSLLANMQTVGSDNSTSSIGQYAFNASNSGPGLEMGLSANATIGTQTVVADGNGLGAIRFSGSDGTAFIRAAQIVSQVDGTPGTNDMPGRLIFSTTADGASVPTERVRITSAGRVGIGTSSPATALDVSGTVTATAFAGSAASLTGLPLSTGVTGTLPIANGGTGATTLAGANIPVTNAANTFTATQTFSGSASSLGLVFNDAAETATVSATAATGTINYDITTQSVLYYTSNASANWTVNFRASSGTSLDTALATGQSVTVAFLVTQGSTAYYNNIVQVDGTTSGVTMRWLGGAPVAGNASGIDSYRYLIIKTGSATFTVLASVTQFKA